MTIAAAPRIHGMTLVRFSSCGSDSPVPGLAGPLPAGFGVSEAPCDGPGLVGVWVDGPDGLVASGEGLGVVAATWLPTCPEAGPAALAAPAVSKEPNSRVRANAVKVILRSIVSATG